VFSFQTLSKHPVYIIAEAGVNHDGCLEKAFALVDAALSAQADAVKFQLFQPHALVTKHAPKALYQQSNEAHASAEESQYALLERLTLDVPSLQAVQAYAVEKGLDFLCSPFDIDSAESLHQDFCLPFLKLGSGELTNLPFLKTLASQQIPLLLSTGMANLAEVKHTAAFLAPFYGESFPDKIAFMHCTSQYPAPMDQLNLKALTQMQTAFPEQLIGYSDHSLSVDLVPAMAVAYGAKIYEKHLTLDPQSTTGPDHQASLGVGDFTRMVQAIRLAKSAMGNGEKVIQPCERNTQQVARKSVVARRALAVGTVLQEGDLTTKRPGTGICASQFERLLGKRLCHAVEADELLSPHAVEGFD
jgi:N,N'-diacetyllegionaminate synthase